MTVASGGTKSPVGPRDPVISTTGLSKSYGSVHAVADLTLSIGGGITGLVGANGAGKSTLIKLLLGLISPTSGQASVLGYPVGADADEIRTYVGYSPEHDCLPPEQSASDFVVHMAQMSGLPRVAARERAAEALRHVGLAEERYRPMGGYSTGMKQRAKLAQAIVHDPRLIFLDEPTNGLDPAARDDMLDLVHRIGADFGIPVVITSHLLGELERVSDNVVILDAGRLLQASETSSFTRSTGTLLVEVLGERAQERVAVALAAAGATCQPRGALLELSPTGPDQLGALCDLVRDTAADLGVGLVRITQGHHRIEDVFAMPPPSGPPAALPAPTTPSPTPPSVSSSPSVPPYPSSSGGDRS